MINVGVNLASESQHWQKSLKSEANPVVGVLAEQSDDAQESSVKQPSSEQTDKERDNSNVVNAVETVNKMLMVKSTNLIFEFHDKEDPPVVKVVDKENGDVIREIPSKELREIAKALNKIADNMGNSSGILFNETL